MKRMIALASVLLGALAFSGCATMHARPPAGATHIGDIPRDERGSQPDVRLPDITVLDRTTTPATEPRTWTADPAVPLNAQPARLAGSAPQGGRTAERRNAMHPWEVAISGAGSNDEDFNAGGGTVAASLGYYFTEVFELSVRQLVSFQDPGKGVSDLWNGATRVAADLHFPIDHVVPYVGAQFGWVYGDTVNETLVAGPEGGLKVYVKEDVFFQAAIEYAFFFEDSDSLDDAFDKGQILYTLGFGIRF